MIKKKDGWSPGILVNKDTTPRSYIIKQENGQVIRKNMFHSRPGQKLINTNYLNTMEWDEIIDEGTMPIRTTDK